MVSSGNISRSLNPVIFHSIVPTCLRFVISTAKISETPISNIYVHPLATANDIPAFKACAFANDPECWFT
jgi:hypothetical protein